MTTQQNPSIGQLIVAAFGIARGQNIELNKRWIQMSYRIGGQLPQSLLVVTIQRIGEVDLVCRALENELLEKPPQDGELDFRDNYLMVLSDWWIGSIYGVCYTLKDRKILTDQAFSRLAEDLRMIRVQIEKHEIPSDRKLTGPLQFAPTQLRPDETEAPIYNYDKDDRLRAHIARKGLSARRSAMWEVFDVNAGEARWYERRELSDRLLDLLAPPVTTA